MTIIYSIFHRISIPKFIKLSSILIAFVSFLLSGCSIAPRYYNHRTRGDTEIFQIGVASYYADKFHGRKTANGETFDMNDFTAAHRTLSFNKKVEVTNFYNNLKVVVRINDRGPFKKGRIIDLSLSAAKKIQMTGPGTAPVRLKIVN